MLRKIAIALLVTLTANLAMWSGASAIPTAATLESGMGYAFQGQPFVNVPANSGINLMNMQYAFGGQPFVTAYASAVASISNVPTSKDFGVVMPATTYYAGGSAYSNPVQDGECTFTITNNGSGSVNLSLSCTNATGGNTWTLVAGTPSGDQIKVTAVYSGQDPASGLVLTNSNQSFYTGLAGSATLKWDFKELTGGTGSGKNGTFSDNAQKTMTILITGS